jgi:hypothetical protein
MPSPQPGSGPRYEYRGLDDKNERIVDRMAVHQSTSDYLRKQSCSLDQHVWRVRCLRIGSHLVPFLQISNAHRESWYILVKHP